MMAIAAGAAIIVVVALIVVGGVFRKSDSTNTAATAAGAQLSGRSIGPDTAPVTVVAWEDFQCPYCKQANQTIVAPLIRDYVNQGLVQFRYKQFAFIGQESVWAAEASECADEQGKFWDYHDILFDNQPVENTGGYSKKRLEQFATKLGLDAQSFNTCLDTDRYKKLIEDELKQGKQDMQITSTPTFFVDGERVTNNDYSVVKAMIDKALKGLQ